MKKFLSFFAIAAVVLGMASCNGNDPVDPQKDAPFRITVSDVTCDEFTVTITPKDPEAEYRWGYVSVPWLEDRTINGKFNPSSQIEDYVLSEYFNDWHVGEGDITERLDAYPNTEHIVFVYQWDEENEKVVIFATQKFTTLIPDGFVDLGLPSGNLWSCDYVLNDNGEGNYMTYSEMYDVFNGAPWWFYMTRKSDWEELRDKCTWKHYTNLFEVTNDSRYNGKNGYQVKGPSGQSIYLPFMGGKSLNGTLSDLGYTGNYWVYTYSHDDDDDYYFCYLTTGSNFFQIGTVNKNCSMSACYICPSYLNRWY